jgi:hypothetical protein
VLGLAVDFVNAPSSGIFLDGIEQTHGLPAFINYGILGGWRLVVNDASEITRILAQDDIVLKSSWPGASLLLRTVVHF